MAKGRDNSLTYRDHAIKEDHSYAQGPGVMPGKHKRYQAKVDGRTVRGSLEEVKARIDHALDGDSAKAEEAK